MTEKANRATLVSTIALAIREELSSLTVPEDMHREHHEFIREWIEERRTKRERAEKIKTQVMGWGLVTLLGSIGTGVYHSFQYLKEHLK
jgi:hypothetical protein